MKKVIIIYGPTSQKHLIDSIIKHCSDDNLIIDAFCTGDYSFNSSSKNQTLPRLYKIISKFLNVRVLGRLIDTIFLTPLLKQLSKTYDIIDITFFTNKYYRFLDYLISIGKKYKATIWGSDFYRMTNSDLIKKGYYLNNAKLIQVETELVKRDVLKKYPYLENKIEVCNYGIDLFDNIDKLRNCKTNQLGIKTDGYVVLTCGYNGSKGQQHIKLFEIIKSLPNDIKRKLFLFIPMTYGLPNSEYLEEVKLCAYNTDIPYHVFTERLNEDELAELRMRSDVVVNIQITDAFSSSLIEHIYAGSILIAGEWLPYSILLDAGIHYHSASIANLGDVLKSVINNNVRERITLKQNIEKARLLSSWQYKTVQLKTIFEDI